MLRKMVCFLCFVVVGMAPMKSLFAQQTTYPLVKNEYAYLALVDAVYRAVSTKNMVALQAQMYQSSESRCLVSYQNYTGTSFYTLDQFSAFWNEVFADGRENTYARQISGSTIEFTMTFSDTSGGNWHCSFCVQRVNNSLYKVWNIQALSPYPKEE